MSNFLMHAIIMALSFLTLLNNMVTINILYIVTPTMMVVLFGCLLAALFMSDKEMAGIKLPKSPRAVGIIKHMVWVFAVLSSAAVGLFFISTCWLISYVFLAFIGKIAHNRQQKLKARKIEEM